MQYHRHIQRGKPTTLARHAGRQPREITPAQFARNLVPRKRTQAIEYVKETGLRTGLVHAPVSRTDAMIRLMNMRQTPAAKEEAEYGKGRTRRP